jgi:hypothetical protein
MEDIHAPRSKEDIAVNRANDGENPGFETLLTFRVSQGLVTSQSSSASLSYPLGYQITQDFFRVGGGRNLRGIYKHK